MCVCVERAEVRGGGGGTCPALRSAVHATAPATDLRLLLLADHVLRVLILILGRRVLLLLLGRLLLHCSSSRAARRQLGRLLRVLLLQAVQLLALLVVLQGAWARAGQSEHVRRQKAAAAAGSSGGSRAAVACTVPERNACVWWRLVLASKARHAALGVAMHAAATRLTRLEALGKLLVHPQLHIFLLMLIIVEQRLGRRHGAKTGARPAAGGNWRGGSTLQCE